MVKELQDLAADYLGTNPENPKSHRWPYYDTLATWNWEETQTELCKKREEIHERLKSYRRQGRENVVLGMCLGSGFGKTHLLTEAPNLLQAQGLYVSFGMNQDLKEDIASPEQALLVRLMLSALGCSQLDCGEFIRSKNFQYFQYLPPELLRNCFLNLTTETLKWGEVVIGIDEAASLDEVASLGEYPIKVIISELSELSYVYTTADPKSRCTCIMSSLHDKAFATWSGRSVEEWVPRKPDDTAFEHFAKGISSMEREKALALANSVCGSHLRSIAIAFNEIKRGSEPTVKSLLSDIYEKLGNKITRTQFAAARKYVLDCICLFSHLTLMPLNSTLGKIWLSHL